MVEKRKKVKSALEICKQPGRGLGEKQQHRERAKLSGKAAAAIQTDFHSTFTHGCIFIIFN